jgi:hypothetical protein
MAFPNEGDRKLLYEFFMDTHSLLRLLIQEDPGKLVEEDMLPSLRDAWKEYQEYKPLEEVRENIFYVDPRRLFRAGLYGAQLQVKLRTVQKHRKRFEDDKKPGLLRKLLDCVDHLLDSLIAATGTGEAMKELKDILSDNTKDA